MLTRKVCYFLFFTIFNLSLYANEISGVDVDAGDMKSFFFEVDGTKFVVHSSSKDEDLATKIRQFANEAVPRINAYFNYKPRDLVNIVFEKNLMSANGYAHTFPYNKISMRLAQPIGRAYLASSVNFYKKLFIHEYIHILHLERTEGISKLGEWVFGSIARLVPQVVPRWFSEGVAMWAEDHFTNEGRLKSDYLNIEVSNFFNRGVCTDISCLDNPAAYPFGALSYWVGGAFLKYVESTKEGAISCIVKDNASIPTIGSSFKNCLGKSHEELFQDFMNSVKPYRDDNIHFQKGLAYKDGEVYYAATQLRRVSLRIKNIKTGEYRDVYIPYFMEKIEQVEGEILITTRSSLSERFNRIIFHYKDGELVELSKGLEAYKGFKSTKDLSLHFKNSWTIKNKDKEILSFDNHETLFATAFVKDNLFFISSNGSYYTFYNVKSDGTIKKTNVADPYSYVGICEDTAIYRHKDKYLLATGSSLKKARIKLSKDVNFIGGNTSETVYLTDAIERKEGSCLSQFFKKKPLVSFSAPLVAKNEKDFKDSKEYSSLFELMPKYWFVLSTITEDNLQYYSVTTSFEDPLQRNQFNVSLDYYSENSDVGGLFSYKRRIGAYNFGVTYNKDFRRSSGGDSSFDEAISLSVNHSYNMNDYLLNQTVYLTDVKSSDLVSKSQIKRAGYGVGFYRYPKHAYEFFNSYYLYGGYARNQPSVGEDFNRYQALADFKFDLYKEYMLTLRGTFEELDKDTLRNGLLFGGGTVESIHQTYGVLYSDVLGNEITTLKANLDLNVLRLNKGWGLVPFYMRTLHVLGGFDQVSADFIYLKDRFYRNEVMNVFYYGLKIDSRVFYRVPLSIEAVFSNSKINDVTDDDFQLIFRSAYTY